MSFGRDRCWPADKNKQIISLPAMSVPLLAMTAVGPLTKKQKKTKKNMSGSPAMYALMARLLFGLLPTLKVARSSVDALTARPPISLLSIHRTQDVMPLRNKLRRSQSVVGQTRPRAQELSALLHVLDNFRLRLSLFG